MTTPTSAMASEQPTPSALHIGRFDLYAQVHKGLRACMAATLVDAGKVDCGDEHDVKRMLDGLDQLLDWCAGHLDKEDRFVHPAIAACDPAAVLRTAQEHAHHAASIAALRASAEQLALAAGGARSAAADTLYRLLAVFVAENLVNMAAEESQNNAILWAHYSDTVLAELHAAIVAATSAAELAQDVRWIPSSLAPSELAALMAGLRSSMPTEVFSQVCGMVRPHLPGQAWCRLLQDLGLPVPASQADPLDTVRRFIDATFVRFDAAAAAQCVSADFVAHPWAAFELPAGAAGLQVLTAAFASAFVEARATVLDCVVAGERVAMRYAYAACHVGELFGVPATGRHFRIEGICFLRLADGLIAEYWREEDMLGLQRQLGVDTLLPAAARAA